MTDRIILCNRCGIHVATIRDAKLKKGIVIYCAQCNAVINLSLNKTKADMPDFLKDIFGKRVY